MTTQPDRGLPWVRILVEGVVIVASVLLALAADAWWDGRQERRNEQEILTGLRADFQATLEEVDRVKRASLEDRDAATRFLAASGPSATGDEIPVDSLLASLVATEAYRPSDATLTSLVTSQGLGPVTNSALRLRLADWSEVDADVRRAFGERDEIYMDHLFPYLRSRIPIRSLDSLLHSYYGPGSSQFPLNTERLLRDLEFENLIADLYFVANQAVISLERAEAAAEQILALLNEGIVASDPMSN